MLVGIVVAVEDWGRVIFSFAARFALSIFAECDGRAWEGDRERNSIELCPLFSIGGIFFVEFTVNDIHSVAGRIQQRVAVAVTNDFSERLVSLHTFKYWFAAADCVRGTVSDTVGCLFYHSRQQRVSNCFVERQRFCRAHADGECLGQRVRDRNCTAIAFLR